MLRKTDAARTDQFSAWGTILRVGRGLRRRRHLCHGAGAAAQRPARNYAGARQGLGHGAKSMRTSIVRLTAAPKGAGGVIPDPADGLELAGATAASGGPPRPHSGRSHASRACLTVGFQRRCPLGHGGEQQPLIEETTMRAPQWIGDRVGTSAGEKPYRLKEWREYKPAGRHRGVGPRGGALLAAHDWPPELEAGRCCPGVWKDSRRCCTWMEPACLVPGGKTHRRRAEAAPSIHKRCHVHSL